MKILLIALSLAATAASAQTLKEMKLDMAQAQVGQNVTATVGLDAGDSANCGMRIKWGDGAITEMRVDDKNAIPYKLSHTYAKAGDYTVIADPQKIKSSLPCIGKGIHVALKVMAPPPPPPAPVAAPVAAAAPMVKATGPSCADGWTLNAKSVVKKTGAYSCTAKIGTALPKEKAVCPGDLTYFENGKKGIFGCRV